MIKKWNAFVDESVEVLPTGVGQLNGFIFGVKDVFSIEGYSNGAGNPDWLRTHKAANQHAWAIERLLAHGATLRGTLQTDELMYSLNGENVHYGTPVNPKAPDRIPGGSSSGSAVAVAAGLVDFALGTDTGGSVRIPSSYCGIYGFRPTHGAVSIDGVIPLAKSFDTVGWMARTPQLLLEIGRTLIDNQNTEGAFSRLLLVEEAWTLLAEDAREVLLSSLFSQAEIGERQYIQLSQGSLAEWSSTFRILQGLEIWREHGEWIQTEKPTFGPGIAERFQWTSTLQAEESTAQYELREEIRQLTEKLLGSNAVFVIPTAPGPAPSLQLSGEAAEQYRARTMQLSCIAGLAGLPQITIPIAEVNGLPIGLSFIANRYQDIRLLQWVAERFVQSYGEEKQL